MMKDDWINGIFGVVAGDALGCPVEFDDRAARKADPVTGMRGYGTFNLPAGSWTDDRSLPLAELESLGEKRALDSEDMMRRFASWLCSGRYTPWGETFDVGIGTEQAIRRYLRGIAVSDCGGSDAGDNGNGSLMRIMPVCIWCYEQEQQGKMSRSEAVAAVHAVSGLTHNHLRSKIACGLYYFMAVSLLSDTEHAPLAGLLQAGITAGRAFYEQAHTGPAELAHYRRLHGGLGAQPDVQDVLQQILGYAGGGGVVAAEHRQL